MNKKLIIGAVVGGAAVAVIVSAKKGESGPKPTIWEKMQDHMEEMPEDFPPRMMFNNVEAARANTEEILDLLKATDRQYDKSETVRSN